MTDEFFLSKVVIVYALVGGPFLDALYVDKVVAFLYPFFFLFCRSGIGDVFVIKTCYQY